ncbi:hemerythrin domain-containing protein [Streptomyces sp. NPDC056309]|uniref:hemerythrin domain-containing protein n=1 Tax=unclassified Streptomyces TaxID=2593676 RepID=UPI0035D95F83
MIEELTADHREIEGFFGRIQTMTGGGQDLRDLVDEVIIELVRHSVVEEYLYPAVRERIQGGDRLADKEIADHSRIEEILKQLEVGTDDDVLVDSTRSRTGARCRGTVSGPTPCQPHPPDQAWTGLWLTPGPPGSGVRLTGLRTSLTGS